jgi:hypothetical protein
MSNHEKNHNNNSTLAYYAEVNRAMAERRYMNNYFNLDGRTYSDSDGNSNIVRYFDVDGKLYFDRIGSRFYYQGTYPIQWQWTV